MKVLLKDIAKIVNGTIVGDENIIISGPAKIEEAKATEITFFDNPKYEPLVYSTGAGALLCSEEFMPKEELDMALLKVTDVRQALSQLLDHYGQLMEVSTEETKIADSAIIDEESQIGSNVSIGGHVIILRNSSIGTNSRIMPSVYIGSNVQIGKDCVIHPGARIYDHSILGDNCIIHCNAVIGADGFGFAPTKNGSFKKIQQVGNVVIGNSVEIGANTCIDRATMGSTIIGDGVKIDNLVQIAHNVVVGQDTVIASQAGIAGSAQIGKNCMIGGQVGIVGHIQIADGTKIQAQSGVNKSTKAGDSLYGSPALNYTDFQRSYIHFKKLPEIEQRLREIEKKSSKS